MKVLHCPTDTGGHAWGLSRAERRLGVESDVMVRRSSWLGFAADIDLEMRGGARPLAVLRLLRFLIAAARTYDVFHFNWGMSILDHRQWGVHYWDLPLLKRLNKRIVVTFQGCDARMKTETRSRFETSACTECDVTWCTARLDAIRRARLNKLSRYADALFVLNPDLMHAVPTARFLPYASVDPADWPYTLPANGGPVVKVLHLPTNRSIKGTRYIEDACASLGQEGWPVELTLVERVSHEQAKRLMAASDVVVDQLLVGWYGAVAVEAMALGKPVLCFLRQSDLERFIPFHARIPIIRTTTTTLMQDLRLLLQRRGAWRDIAEAGRRYIEEYHDPMHIAACTVAAYRGRGTGMAADTLAHGHATMGAL